VSRLNIRSTSRYFLLLPGLLFLVFGCASSRGVPVKEDLLVSEDEKMIWRESLEEQNTLNASGIILNDTLLTDYLGQIVLDLQPAQLSAEMSFKVFVVKDPHLNAFAFPNGAIYVHTGLLARMNNEAQFAALIAHEMAHCTRRHALRAFRSYKNRNAFMASVQHTLAGLPMVQEVTQVLGLNGSLAAVAGYTRALETEADIVGLDSMVMADYDPYEALRLFEHLKKEIESEQIKEPFFFGTHPQVQARMNTIKGLLETKYKGKQGGIKNTEIFLSKIGPVILENARLDLRIGRFAIAQSGVEKYLRFAKDDAAAYYLMGEIFRQRGQEGDAEMALSYYNKAITIDPSYSEPHKAIGLIHYKEGQKALAKRFFESCLLLAPDAPDKAYIQGYIKQCANDGEG
jgi:tetratricopeptide (TPR) repeat protein